MTTSGGDIPEKAMTIYFLLRRMALVEGHHVHVFPVPEEIGSR